MSGALYVVGTPIGNLKDFTFRAVEVLQSVDLILCEDTRRTRILLDHYAIRGKKLLSYFEGNERRRVQEVLPLLQEGQKVALLCDAGTPGISDPGYRIVRAARQAGIPVYAVPGPSAVTAALSVSGLPTDRFVFEGFLPKKPGKRRKRLEALKQEPRTIVLYESVHRITRTLREILEVLGDREVAVLRELTKLHEEGIFGSLSQVIPQIEGKKGEFVIVIHGSEEEGTETATSERA